jgi:hypothetical protein
MGRKLFISYSHEDTALLKTLRTHLRPLERAGVIEPWFDGYMLVGDDIDTQVRRALEEADFIALLASPDFMASDYCQDIEMQRAVQRHEEGTARLIPIIARQCGWKRSPFGNLKATPTDGRPVMSAAWPDKDEAWDIVARDIELAASEATSALAPRDLWLRSEPTPVRWVRLPSHHPVDCRYPSPVRSLSGIRMNFLNRPSSYWRASSKQRFWNLRLHCQGDLNE